jgi:phenylalanine-4-hydroxylase
LRSQGFDSLANLAALYWYTVEFGLISTSAGLRIYGAGIVSSPSETLFALHSPAPHRLHFDLERVMRTTYRIDDFQQTYFVIDSFADLFDATLKDFAPIYQRLAGARLVPPDALLAQDHVHWRGDQSHAHAHALSR